MAREAECVICGGRFEAKRSTAKYCSGRCRVRATRAGIAGQDPAPARREGGAVIALNVSDLAAAFTPPRAPASSSLLEATERELEKAGRTDTPDGQAALYLARALTDGGGQTGSSIASLIREHRTALAKAIEGANVEETPLEATRRMRERRLAGA